MIILYDHDTEARIGVISEEELSFLKTHLEKESAEDQDYYIAAVTLDMMEKSGGAPELARILRDALGSADGVEIRWERE